MMMTSVCMHRHLQSEACMTHSMACDVAACDITDSNNAKANAKATAEADAYAVLVRCGRIHSALLCDSYFEVYEQE